MCYPKLSSEVTTSPNALFRTFFSVWMAFAYLGVALFYPATCDPSGLRGDYTRGNYTINTNTLSASVVEWEQKNVAQTATQTITLTDTFLDDTDSIQNAYITSDSASNASWLLHSRLPAATAQSFVIDFVVITALPHRWADESPSLLSLRFWLSQFHHQFKALPPERPPKLLA